MRFHDHVFVDALRSDLFAPFSGFSSARRHCAVNFGRAKVFVGLVIEGDIARTASNIQPHLDSHVSL